MLGEGAGLGQAQGDRNDVDHGEQAGDGGGHGKGVDPVGRGRGVEGRKIHERRDAAEGGAEDEADAEGDADNGHAAGAVFLGGDVGHDGGGGGDVGAHDAAEESRKEQEPEAAGEDPQEVGQGDAAQGDEQHGAASNTIRNGSEEGGAEKLEQGVDRAEDTAEEDHAAPMLVGRTGQFAELEQAAVKPAEQARFAFEFVVIDQHAREERKDDGKADQVDEEGEEYESEDTRLAGCARRGGCGGRDHDSANILGMGDAAR